VSFLFVNKKIHVVFFDLTTEFASTVMLMKNILLISILLLFFACQKEDIGDNSPVNVVDEHPHLCEVPETGDRNFIYYENDERWLIGGENEDQDFNITNWTLEEGYIKYGLGRETFKALTEPQFISKEEYPRTIQPDELVLAVYGGLSDTKVYTIDMMEAHEVINDEINGEPIVVMYCPLADFFAVYYREYCGATLTFGVSGYTYYQCDTQDGKDGFLLWDRNTESLWWPLTHKGVSGEMLNQTMTPYHAAKWEVTTYEQISQSSPDFVLLKPGQNIDFDGEWTSSLSQSVNCVE